MLQLIQSFKTGETILEEIPSPIVKPGHLLIKTRCSLVSLGTEKMLVEFGKSSLISKARQQPDKVKQVLDKIKTEGLLPTLEAVFNKLEQPIPLGYCNVGEVIEAGHGCEEFKVGDRVASNGSHAEIVCVPKNLCAKIPDGVTDHEAAFTVIGSIGLQGIRLINPAFGETIVVYGLGLIGLLSADMLRAMGCRVIGLDIDDSKVEIARKKGIDAYNIKSGADPVSIINSLTRDIGADAVLITASVKSDEIISNSAKMSRKRGRIVLVGVIGLNISRADFYEKELSFQVSCSYGPGRYDENYEAKGIDYPLPFVRWTEKRNFEAILSALENNQIKVKDLITELVELGDYKKVYENLSAKGSIASILTYNSNPDLSANIVISKEKKLTDAKTGLGIIGAGNFTKMTMLPALQKCKANIVTIASSTGVSGAHLASKFNIINNTTDYRNILGNDAINTVMITTRHGSHSWFINESMRAGKNVFVEKPLAVNKEQLKEVVKTFNDSPVALNVGFNRRFAPVSIKTKELLGDQNLPISVIATMNAGNIPKNVWVHDLESGGGRIIGEACHYIDLVTYFTGSLVKEVYASSIGNDYDASSDTVSIHLKYQNGSLGVINYFSNGNKSYSKERYEVYQAGKTLVMDNFRTLQGYGFRGFSKLKTKLDKGHFNQFRQIAETPGKQLIPVEELINTTLASFAAVESFMTSRPVRLEKILLSDED